MIEKNFTKSNKFIIFTKINFTIMLKINQLNGLIGTLALVLFCSLIPNSIWSTNDNIRLDKNTYINVVESPSFEKTIFSKSDLSEILGFKECAGIRFYKAADSNPNSPNSLIAVGITKDGSEISGNSLLFFQAKNYFWKVPSEEPNLNPADRYKENHARSMVEELQSRNEMYLIVDFSMEDIERIFQQNGSVAGIKFVPKELRVDANERDESKLFQTMGIIGVDKEFQEVGEMQIKSQPCPPICPYTGKYLIPTS